MVLTPLTLADVGYQPGGVLLTIRRSKTDQYALLAEDVIRVNQTEGPVTAAILAAGVGALTLGILTTLAEASTGIKDFLNLYDPVGPLAGKTIGAVLVWLVAWGVLHMMYKDKEVESRGALTASLVMIGLGVLGTFPIFFQLFTPAE